MDSMVLTKSFSNIILNNKIKLFWIALLNGDGDNYPEASFYMVGNIDEAYEKGR